MPWTYFTAKAKRIAEYLREVFHYYSCLSFAKADFLLLLSYAFTNPYRLCRTFFKQSEWMGIYGETPLVTLEQIARECDISLHDTVIDLGCGRGRGCFWLAAHLHCRIIGIDLNPTFIAKAKGVQRKCRLKELEFRCADFFSVDLSGASVIYLYGSCLSEQQVELLAEHLSHLPKGVKIITVSYPITEREGSPFTLLKQFKAHFPWGETEVYLQRL